MSIALYSIVSTSGLHYRNCSDVWDAFKTIRRCSPRFVVQRIDPTGEIHWFNSLGNEVAITIGYVLEERYVRETERTWNFHRSHCRQCQTGQRCELGEMHVYQLLGVRRASRKYAALPF